MAHLVNTPQFKLPFQIHGGDVAVVEQDSDEDKAQNAEVIMRYAKGERTALPDFGIPDQALRENGVSPEEIVSHVLTWEPDVEIEVIEDLIEDGVAHATVELGADSDQPTVSPTFEGE